MLAWAKAAVERSVHPQCVCLGEHCWLKLGGIVRAGPEESHQEKDRFKAEGSSSGCSPVNLVFSV